MKVTIKVSVTGLGDIPKDQASLAFGKVYGRRGYLVIGTVPGAVYELGRRLRQVFQYETKTEFEVVAYTHAGDMREQLEMLKKDNPSWVESWPMEMEKGSRFYRIVPVGARARLKRGKLKPRGRLA